MSKAERIYVSIDVTKIDKTHLFKGREKDGHTPMYLSLTLMPSSKFPEQDWFCTQGVSKEARLAGAKGPIIGNAKFADRSASTPATDEQASSKPAPPEMDDVPFN